MKNGFTESEMNGGEGFSKRAVKINTIGIESNEFIKALSELYGFPTQKLFTTKTITSTAFSLNKKNADLDKSDYYKFKVFLEGKDTYGELFLNINTDEKIIELHEKDQEYREAIIKVLSQ
jgi:hypothetical protein